MKRIASILTFAALSLPLGAQKPPTRPKITGIDHVRVYVTNIDRSREFYSKLMGVRWEEGVCYDKSRPCFAVGWGKNQTIRLEEAPDSEIKNWIAEIAFSTDNVEQMRKYLASRGVQVSKISKYSNSNSNQAYETHFEAHDPEGTPISFIQRFAYTIEHPASTRLQDWPTFTQELNVRILHAGFVVKDLERMKRFYIDLLGFRLYWHGGFKDDGTDWYEIQVPDGDNWIEFMLNIPSPANHKELGVQNHFSLGVTNIKSAFDLLVAHGLKVTDDKPEIGRDGKWSFDIYDPDDTRVEFMEFKPAQKPCCHPYEAAHPTP